MITIEEQMAELHAKVKRLEQTQVKIGSGTLSAANTSTQTGSVTLPDGTVVANVGVIGNYIPEAGQQVHFLTNGTQPIIYPPTAPIVSAPPAQVSGVTATPGIGSLVIRWAAIIEADVKWNRGYYQVDVDTVNTFNSGNLKSADAAGTAATITGLTTGTLYYVRVRALDYVGQAGTYSATTTGTPVGVTNSDLSGVSGIETVGALPTLPHASYPQGKVVFLTTDNKLYRSTGSAWTAAVPAVDVTGQITNTQIADNSISTPKLQANSITANELAANSITAADMLANTITAGQIASATITATQIASATITSTQIAADTILAGNIAANAIDTSELNANAVTAAKIAAVSIEAGKYVRSTTYVAGSSGWSINADGSAEFQNVLVRGEITGTFIYGSTFTGVMSGNMLTNPGAETNTTGWTATNNTLTRNTTAGQFRTGSAAFKLQCTSAGDMYIQTPTGTSGFAVKPGVQYSAAAFFKSAATSRSCRVEIYFYDAAGASVGSPWAATYPDGTNLWRSVQVSVGGGIGATVRYVSVRVTILAAATNEIHYVDDISLQSTSTMYSDLVTGPQGVPRLQIYSDIIPQIIFDSGIDGENSGQIYKQVGLSGQSLDRKAIHVYSGYMPGGATGDESYIQLESKGAVSGFTPSARVKTKRFYVQAENTDWCALSHSSSNNVFGATTSTNSGTSAEPGTVCRITNFIKRTSESYIEIRAWANSLFVNTGLGSIGKIFVYDGTNTHEIGRAFFPNSSGNTNSIFGVRHVMGGTAAGTYTFMFGWCSNGTEFLNSDGNSSYGLSVTEIAAP